MKIARQKLNKLKNRLKDIFFSYWYILILLSVFTFVNYERKAQRDEAKIVKQDFFLEEAREEIKPSSFRLIKLIADTDRLPRLIWNGETVMLYANEPFLEMTGYDLKDIQDKPFFNKDGTSDFIVAGSVKASKEVVKTNAAGGIEMTTGIVNRWHHKDGHEITIEWIIGFNDYVSGIGSCQAILINDENIK